MITKTDKIVFGSFGIIIVLLFAFSNDLKSLQRIEKNGNELFSAAAGNERSTDIKTAQIENNSEVRIIKKWDLPGELKEVSGIAYLDEQRFACVQDEEGSIFIFNPTSNSIEKKIAFGDPGDYEDIAVIGDIAYVLRADGKIFEANIKNTGGKATQHNTSLTVEHNVEGLCYDKANNRLLLAIKDDEPGKPDFKGIYAFDLSKKAFIKEPAYKLDLKNELLRSSGKKKDKTIKPSAIGIHPTSNDIYIVDGPKAKLLVMDNLGKIKRMLELGKDFSQPEGIAFSEQGEMFISNEGTKSSGNILQVQLP
jgi:uncharacterized protein YjiK